jgi:hypothetical protein
LSERGKSAMFSSVRLAGAKTALEACGLHERGLHRMQFAVVREAFDGGHGVAVGAKGRNQAAMHGDVVEPYGACAAIARIASFLDPEPSHIAQESSEALPRPRLFRERFAVDQVTHGRTLSRSSRLSSSAK